MASSLGEPNKTRLPLVARGAVVGIAAVSHNSRQEQPAAEQDLPRSQRNSEPRGSSERYLVKVDLLEDKIDNLQRQLTLRDATFMDLTYVKTDLAKNLRKVEKEMDADKAKIARLSTQVNDCAIAYKALYQEKLEEG
ncbi:hypothetical protein SRHO_G00327270 [Serrasalmus rhombeus]